MNQTQTNRVILLESLVDDLTSNPHPLLPGHLFRKAVVVVELTVDCVVEDREHFVLK